MKDYRDNILSNLNESDLTEDMKFISEVIGFEKTKELINYLGGARVNIVKVETYRPVALRNYLKENRPEANDYLKLCRDFNVSRPFLMRELKKIEES